MIFAHLVREERLRRPPHADFQAEVGAVALPDRGQTLKQTKKGFVAAVAAVAAVVTVAAPSPVMLISVILAQTSSGYLSPLSLSFS